MILSCIAILGLTSVALGAMGAHMLEGVLTAAQFKTFETAVEYHQLYAVLVLVLELFRRFSKAGNMVNGRVVGIFFVSICIFSGTLYTYLLTGSPVFVKITPVGGLGLMLGWGVLGWNAWCFSRIKN